MGPEKFQFRFRTENDLQVVLSKGPYHYKRWMLLLQRWEPLVSENFPNTITFWIRIHGIPLHFCNEATVTTIGDNLGNLVDKVVDEAKIRVEFNGFNPLEMTMEIQLPTDEILQVEFEYIKIEKHCFTCFSLFHEDDTCLVKPRNAPPIKERKLGITQRVALQRIEADKRRHDDRRGYRRPIHQPPPHLPRREESRHRSLLYSDNRDSYRTPRDSHSMVHRELPPLPRDQPSHYSPLESSRRSPRSNSRVLSSGVRVQNQDVPVDPLSNPSGGTRPLPVHTPSPRNLRERLEFPLGSGGNIGDPLTTSGERRSALVRVGEVPTSFDSARLQEVDIRYDGIMENEIISPLQAPTAAHGQSSRVPATRRLGNSEGPTIINFERDTEPPPDPVLLSKSNGKKKTTKPSVKKRTVRSSPLHGLNLRKINVARSVNPPRKKLCVDRDTTLPCDKAGPSTNTRAGRTRGKDFRPPPPPLP